MWKSPIRLNSCGAYFFGWNLIPLELVNRFERAGILRDYRRAGRSLFGWTAYKARRTNRS